MAKLTSALPKGEANGLAALDRDLIDNPSAVHVVSVKVGRKKRGCRVNVEVTADGEAVA